MKWLLKKKVQNTFQKTGKTDELITLIKFLFLQNITTYKLDVPIFVKMFCSEVVAIFINLDILLC